MVKKGNVKVTLSLSTPIYDSFRAHCQEKAILLSKKVELWMQQEMQGNPVYFGGLSKSLIKGKNKKITLSINQNIYLSFQTYCEQNAIMLSRKVEIWMSKEVNPELDKISKIKEAR